MAVGDIVKVKDTEYEIVWDGGEGLIGERLSKAIGDWEPPMRIYNKTGKHSKTPKEPKSE